MASRVRPGADGKIRLDIGAGHVRHEGWTRVDQPNVTRHNFRLDEADIDLDPDVPCDVRAIPLPDNFADEARSIHVIEHFYAWEALDVMREWVRVIKPGAMLAVECPDLDKVLALAQVPECPPRHLHWALYGDPRYKEPAMVHKWAYTKLSLAKLMLAAGLENIKTEPAQFHVQYRDLRLIGFKKQGLVITP